MNRPLTIGFLSFALLAAVFFISGCGEEVCVAGIGDCDMPAVSSQTGTTTASSGTVVLYSSIGTAIWAAGNTVYLTANGGKAPHTFQVIVGPTSGTFTETSQSDVQTVTAYKAPARGSLSQDVIVIETTDAENHKAQIALRLADSAR